ncbi:unnamed protein product, partial [Didymodactylos carnosus]
ADSHQFINDSFEVSSGEVDENLTNKGKCMSTLLYLYFSQQPIPSTFIAFDKTYRLKQDIIDTFKMFGTPSPTLITLTIAIKDKYDDYQGMSFNHLDTNGIKLKLLQKLRDCEVKCSCCGRQCDADHTISTTAEGSEHNKHSCQTGHQLRAMGGIKYEITNAAPLSMCEKLKDNDLITNKDGNIRQKWSEFKNQHSDWTFDTNNMSKSELLRIRAKYTVVWAKIGEKLRK